MRVPLILVISSVVALLIVVRESRQLRAFLDQVTDLSQAPLMALQPLPQLNNSQQIIIHNHTANGVKTLANIRELLSNQTALKTNASITGPSKKPSVEKKGSEWIRSIPMLPQVRRNCVVLFIDEGQHICYNEANLYDQIALQVTLRLLEHKFECRINELPIANLKNESPSKCFHVRPGKAETNNSQTWSHPESVFLLPYLYQDYYMLKTMKSSTPPTPCSIGTLRAKSKNLKRFQRLDSLTDWKIFYETARYCDYIATSQPIGLVIADSMAIPTASIHHNLSDKHLTLPSEFVNVWHKYPPPPAVFKGQYSRFDYTRAEEIAHSFPYELFTSKVETQNQPATTNKTLVVMIGSLRGGERTWSSAYKHLLDFNSADLALMVGVVQNKTGKSPYLRAKYVWEFPEYDDWADAIDTIDGPEWRHRLVANLNGGLLGGALTNKRGSGAIIFMARFWLSQRIAEINLTDHYDRFIVTRSDFFYKCPQNLRDYDPRFVWVPAGEDYGGITDRHVIAPSGLIHKVLNVLPPLLKHPERYSKRRLQINPEGQIKLQWTVEGIYPHNVRRFPMMMYTCFVRGDRSRWAPQKFQLGRTEDGVYSKYGEEYVFASCYCGGGVIQDAITLSSNWSYSDARQKFNCS